MAARCEERNNNTARLRIVLRGELSEEKIIMIRRFFDCWRERRKDNGSYEEAKIQHSIESNRVEPRGVRGGRRDFWFLFLAWTVDGTSV